MTTIRLENLGELIKKAIKDSGLKESFIADKMGISRQYLNQVELKKNFDLDFLQKLKDASKIDFTYLINPIINQDYEEATLISKVEEPLKGLNQNIDISLNIKISGDSNDFENLSDLIKTIKTEAKKRGFTIN